MQFNFGTRRQSQINARWNFLKVNLNIDCGSTPISSSWRICIQLNYGCLKNSNISFESKMSLNRDLQTRTLWTSYLKGRKRNNQVVISDNFPKWVYVYFTHIKRMKWIGNVSWRCCTYIWGMYRATRVIIIWVLISRSIWRGLVHLQRRQLLLSFSSLSTCKRISHWNDTEQESDGMKTSFFPD